MIIAQNWKDDVDVTYNCTVLEYDKLGIVGARMKLREEFLKSGYDILIMLDDDCDIRGTENGANRYLSEIENHGKSFGKFRGSQLKLFSIHKDILREVNYDNIQPENAEGFEDTVFVKKVESKFKDNMFEFNINELYEVSLGANDRLSTWYNGQDLIKMLNKTREEVHKYE